MVFRSILFFMFITTGVVFSQDEPRDYTMSVTGTSEIRVQADRATFCFEVEAYGKTLRKAVGKAKTKTSQITAKLLELGVKRQHLHTDHFYSGEHQGSRAWVFSKKDYKTSITTSVTIDSLDLLEEILFALSELKVEDISSITFSLENFAGHKESSRLTAIAEAREKAETMAVALNLSLDGVLNVSESYSAVRPQGVNQHVNIYANSVTYKMNSYDEGSMFFGGEVSVETEVEVVFQFVNDVRLGYSESTE